MLLPVWDHEARPQEGEEPTPGATSWGRFILWGPIWWTIREPGAGAIAQPDRHQATNFPK